MGNLILSFDERRAFCLVHDKTGVPICAVKLFWVHRQFRRIGSHPFELVVWLGGTEVIRKPFEAEVVGDAVFESIACAMLHDFQNGAIQYGQ